MTTVSNYALRLQASLLEEVKRIVVAEGTTVNQFINVAVAEKAAAIRTEAYFAERRRRVSPRAFKRLLEQAGTLSPRPGDEMPEAPRKRKRGARVGRPART